MNGAAYNSTWITIVLITAILMIVFMLFFGYRPTAETPTAPQATESPNNS